MIPKVLKNYNLFVDGTSFLGRCTQVSLPELTIATEEYRGGGMDVPISLDMGMEMPELGFTMAEHVPEVFRQFGVLNQNAVRATFRSALVDDTVVTPYVIEVTGMYNQLTLGDTEVAQVNPLEANIMCRFFRLTLEGQNLIEIDVDNMRRIINGVDVLAEQRAALQA